MRIWTFVVIGALAALTAGCGGTAANSGRDSGQGRASVSMVGEGGTSMAAPIGMQVSGSGTFPGITVTGSGTASAVPDVADWSFGVQSAADTASAALREAADVTNRIVGALRDKGIAKEDLRTEQVSLYPRMTDDGRTVTGYTASSSVNATVRGLAKAGAIVDAAVRAGANQVSGPALRVSDSRAQYREAVGAALDDARARAEALAAKAGVTLGAPVAIVENGGGYPGPVYDRVAAAEAAVAIEPGVQEIGANLTVTFAIS